MNWIATQTRPDLAFDVCSQACSVKDGKVSDLLKVQKVIRKAKSNRVKINFPPIDLSSVNIVVYSDASYGNLPDGSSQGGFIIFLSDKHNTAVPISWSSTKIKRIVRSTLAAESMALQEGADSAVLLSSLISELIYGDSSKKLEIRCCTDSHGLYRSLISTKTVQDRRLRIDIARLREMMERKEIDIVDWVENTNQLADCLTKRTASSNSLLTVLHTGKLRS